jgi:hypothetical protein
MRPTLLVVILVALAACSGASSVPVGAFPTRAQQAYCSFAVRCQTYATEADCEADNPTGSVASRAISEVNAGHVKYDADAAGKCLDEYAGLSCDAFLTGPLELIQLLLQCDKVFTGTVADGGACIVNEDCVSQACNQTGCATGTCGATTVYVPDGGDCSAGGQCVLGDVCVTSGTSMTCQKPTIVADGQACDPRMDLCVAGEVCVGRCEKLAGTGEDCSLLPCTSTDYCDSTTTKCTALPGPGSPCENNTCVPYGYCDTTGTCAARAGVGESCASAQCQSNLNCDLPAQTCSVSSTTCT